MQMERLRNRMRKMLIWRTTPKRARGRLGSAAAAENAVAAETERSAIETGIETETEKEVEVEEVEGHGREAVAGTEIALGIAEEGTEAETAVETVIAKTESGRVRGHGSGIARIDREIITTWRKTTRRSLRS